MFSNRQEGRGFTLIELLVVIGIIGVLSTIVITSLSSARAKSRDAKRVADIKSIQLALALYYTDNGMYPVNIYAAAGPAPTGGLAPTYLPVVPTDPLQTGACTTGTQTSCYRYAAYKSTAAGACGTTFIPNRYRIGAILEETSNRALIEDVDAPGNMTSLGFYLCTGALDFHGTSVGCVSTAGTAQPGGTETCYDQLP